MTIGKFFEDVGHDIKQAILDIGHEFAAVLIKLFGATAVATFIQAAEQLFESDFGKVLQDAVSALLAGFAAGTPFSTLLKAVVELIASEAEKAGIAIGEEVLTLLATLLLNKLNGNFAATQAAIQKLSQQAGA
jgi:hypothetical protein